MTSLKFDIRDFNMLKSLFRLALVDRFIGSGLGLIWAILSPLMLMGLFTFVFTFVFPNRMPGQGGPLQFTIWLLSGYGPWLAINEGIMSATSSVSGNAGIIKNIAFKSEILPVVGAMLGIVPLLVSFLLIIPLQFAAGTPPGFAYLFIPVVIVLHLIFVSGIGLFLSALNVFIRDTALALPNILTLVLFASPIFYPLKVYPHFLQPYLRFNPFYVIASCYRAPIVDGMLPPLWMLLYLVVFSTIVFVGGLAWFRRLQTFFDTRL